ncbi:MAG: peptidase M14, partial [Salegentibacter sp.]
VDQGDLSTSYGYQNLDASEYKIVPGKIYSETFADTSEVQNLDFSELLKNGYAYLKLKQLPEKSYTALPLNLVSEDFQVPQKLHPGIGANFFLEKDGKPEYAVINGFLVELKKAPEEIINAMVFP